MKHYVYILSCHDDTYYTGYTRNIRRRINQHNGVGFWPGAKYTKSRRPVFLQHLENYPTKRQAIAREKEIKALTKEGRRDLIKQTTKEDIIAAI